MTYEDAGFNRSLTKSSLPSLPDYTEGDTSTMLSSVSGTRLAGGRQAATNGGLLVDWDQGLIIFADDIGLASSLGNLVGYGAMVAEGDLPRIFMGEDDR